MKTYLVGGAIRDQLLGLPVLERDWVVVGATPQAMIAKGFKPVGKDFPVFLHPESHEEYALARTERKAGQGHQGFTFYSAPDVTLEQDLIRRDLTINAIAQDPDTGEFIDPFHGQQDLQHKVLRHVSDAFGEDPLRVYRVARFYAKFKHLGFTIAPETLLLMKSMTDSGELDTLSDERIWRETHKALKTQNPEAFFQVLLDIGALKKHFPKMTSKGIQTLTDLMGHQSKEPVSPEIRFACACFEGAIKLTTPKAFADLQKLTAQYHQQLASLFSHTPETILTLLKKTDALRRTERWQQLLLASLWIHRDELSKPMTTVFKNAMHLVSKLKIMAIDDLVTQYQDHRLAEAIKERELQKIHALARRLDH